MQTVNAGADLPLRGARVAQGLGLREVAQAAGLDPGQLSKIERGLRQPTLPVLHRLAQVLGLRDLERFLGPYDLERR